METSRFRQIAFALLSLAVLPAAAFLGRAAFDSGDGTFSGPALIRGVRATQEQCAAAPEAVWAVTATGEAECLRYWGAGLQPGKNQRALVFFQGDQLAGNTIVNGAYTRTRPAEWRTLVKERAAAFGVPYILLARPGTFGSSGEHKQRRRAAEAQLVSAALDEIKKLHGIEELVVSGHSGGGHVVASLLNYRSDIVCAVAAAGVLQPAERARIKGWAMDSNGYADSYEPAQHLDAKRWHPQLRVFVLGDPMDSNVPWDSQIMYAHKVKSLGGRVETLQGEGRGPERHGLTNSARQVAAWCAQGLSTPEILERAGKGLKG